MRKKLSKKGSDTADDLKSKFDEILSDLTEKFEAAKEEACGLYEKEKHKSEEIKKDVKTQMS